MRERQRESANDSIQCQAYTLVVGGPSIFKLYRRQEQRERETVEIQFGNAACEQSSRIE